MEILVGTFQGIASDISAIWGMFLAIWYIAIPILFYPVFMLLWMDHIQTKYAMTISYTLLEVIPPQNLEKSPQLMESIYIPLAGILSTFNVLEEFVEGRFTNKFSFELVGEAGSVRMLIRTPTGFRNLVESHLYAQYPDVEIREVEDYVGNVPSVMPNREWDLWGTDLVLVGPDPLPIKTYDYFEESVTGKMIDPMAGMIEALGKVGPNQMAWFQMVIVPVMEKWSVDKETRDFIEEFAGNKKKKKNVGIIEGVIGQLSEFLKNLFPAMFQSPTWEHATEDKAMDPLDLRLTPGKRKALEALEANVGRNVFSTKMRFVYLGRRENFTKSVVSSFIGSLKQFADMNLNSFKPDNTSKTFANFVAREPRLRYRQRKIFRRYKDRDTDGKKFILSTKELASVYHMPDMGVISPYLQRVPAKKGGAPANLPI